MAIRNDVNRQWVLKNRPPGPIQADTFELRETPVPTPGPGEILIRNLWLSFDPAQRGWLNDMRSYIPPVQIGEPMRAGAVGQVIESNHPDFKPGNLVQGAFGWQDYIATKAAGMLPVTKLPPGVPPNMALSILGLTGLTAYFGMLDIGEPKPGQTVVVSSAAGATGSAAGQIAKIKGAANVIGIAGGKEKCAWLTREAHFDVAIDYKNEDVGKTARRARAQGHRHLFRQCRRRHPESMPQPHRVPRARGAVRRHLVGLWRRSPVGIGADQLLHAADQFRAHGRLHRSRITPRAIPRRSPNSRNGSRKAASPIARTSPTGLENAPETLKRLFVGANFGKQLMKIADPLLPVI